MYTVIDAVREIIKAKPMVEEALRIDILNLAKYAKIIHLEVNKITMKQVQIGAITIALSRLKTEIQESLTQIFYINDIILKYPLTELTYIQNDDHYEKIAKVYKNFSDKQNHFLNIISGNTETGIFINSKYKDDIIKAFVPHKPIQTLSKLAGVSLKFSEEYFEGCGLIYSVVKAMTWEKIQIVELISTYTEITLVIHQVDSQKVFDVMSKNFLGID